MTRFQSRALPEYTPERRQSPLAGIWNGIAAWYSMPAETREKIANWFSGTEEVVTPEQQAINETPRPPEYLLPVGGNPDRGPREHSAVPDTETLGYNGPKSWDEFEVGKKLAFIEDPDEKQRVWDLFLKGGSK